MRSIESQYDHRIRASMVRRLGFTKMVELRVAERRICNTFPIHWHRLGEFTFRRLLLTDSRRKTNNSTKINIYSKNIVGASRLEYFRQFCRTKNTWCSQK